MTIIFAANEVGQRHGLSPYPHPAPTAELALREALGDRYEQLGIAEANKSLNIQPETTEIDVFGCVERSGPPVIIGKLYNCSMQ